MSENLKLLGFLDVLGFTNIFNRIGLTAMNERYSELTEYVREQTSVKGMGVRPTQLTVYALLSKCSNYALHPMNG